MQSKLFSKCLLTVILTALVSAVSAISVDPIYVPTSLNPGDPYHLIFVTSGTRDATSADITVYDAFVQAFADAVNIGTGSTLFNASITWHAVASTPTVAANTNTFNPSSPIFNIADTRIALNQSDLFDGTLESGISFNENGGFVSNLVWTGSLGDGSGKAGNELGSGGDASLGSSTGTNSGWLLSALADQGNNQKPFFAISEELTVPSQEVPIPTLNEWGIIVLMTLLAGAAAWKMNKPELLQA